MNRRAEETKPILPAPVPQAQVSPSKGLVNQASRRLQSPLSSKPGALAPGGGCVKVRLPHCRYWRRRFLVTQPRYSIERPTQILDNVLPVFKSEREA